VSPVVVAALVALNLIVIFLLLAVPLGVRTIVLKARVAAPGMRIWQALYPLGADAGWSGEILSAEALGGGGEGGALARLKLSWEGRDNRPIERKVRLSDIVEGERYTMRVEDDSSLAVSFWADYREDNSIADDDGASLVVLRRTDRYRGLAFPVFRFFAMRRELARLRQWAETGSFVRGGLFERPLTQLGFAALSALILWPLFGLSRVGLLLAVVLTTVVALHELGHMAAFRVMGHRRVRMIFIPLLGGIAIGGRPYDSRFEVAFVALMGAGFSAFIIPIAIASSDLAGRTGHPLAASTLATLAGFAAFFNIANLVPVWKFDGGQVLRQVFPSQLPLAFMSFATLLAFLALGHLAGLSMQALIVIGTVFAVLSLITTGSGVKPRHELKPLVGFERVALAAAFTACFAVHFYGVLWAVARLT
jgi:Zn-dependent protease